MHDNLHNQKFVVAIAPLVETGNTAHTSFTIDRLGYESLTFVILTGTLADDNATFEALMQHGDIFHQEYQAIDDPENVDDVDMISQTSGTAPELAAGFSFAADNATRRVAYLGSKRYVELTVTPSGNSGNAPLAVLAVLGHPHSAPAS